MNISIRVLAFGIAIVTSWLLMCLVWCNNKSLGGASGVAFGLIPALIVGYGKRLRSKVLAQSTIRSVRVSRVLLVVMYITGGFAAAYWMYLIVGICRVWISGKISFW
jgi:hypothetical protein